jgi:hypothetical protein
MSFIFRRVQFTIHRDLLQLELFTIHRDLQLEIVAIHRDLLLLEMLAIHRDLLQLKMLYFSSASSTIGCSFEYGEKCFLDNDSGDQFDWNYESVR